MLGARTGKKGELENQLREAGYVVDGSGCGSVYARGVA